MIVHGRAYCLVSHSAAGIIRMVYPFFSTSRSSSKLMSSRFSQWNFVAAFSKALISRFRVFSAHLSQSGQGCLTARVALPPSCRTAATGRVTAVPPFGRKRWLSVFLHPCRHDISTVCKDCKKFHNQQYNTKKTSINHQKILLSAHCLLLRNLS